MQSLCSETYHLFARLSRVLKILDVKIPQGHVWTGHEAPSKEVLDCLLIPGRKKNKPMSERVEKGSECLGKMHSTISNKTRNAFQETLGTSHGCSRARMVFCACAAVRTCWRAQTQCIASKHWHWWGRLADTLRKSPSFAPQILSGTSKCKGARHHGTKKVKKLHHTKPHQTTPNHTTPQTNHRQAKDLGPCTMVELVLLDCVSRRLQLLLHRSVFGSVALFWCLTAQVA